MHNRLILLALVIWGLSACNLSTEPQVEDLTPTTAASGQPTVEIVAPADGEEFVVDEAILVSATATDTQGVTRVQLLADGQIVKTVSSESPTGDTNLNVLLDYTPEETGTVELEVIAFRGAAQSDPASVTVNVRQNQAQVTSTPQTSPNLPVIDPNDPTCRALTNVGLNFREGPSTDFDRISVIPAGTIVPIIGRIGSNEWWRVRFGGRDGWVSADFTTVYGICTNVPVIQQPRPTVVNPPTSTPAPTFTPLPTNTPPPTNTPGPPDLIISNIDGPETVTIPSGADSVTENYDVTITNTGGSATNQFNNIIIVNPGDAEFDLGAVAGLGAGQSINLSVDITFETTGSFTLRARADSNGNVNEQSEVNNEGFLSVTVSPAD